MTVDEIRAQLIEVLCLIQKDSGYPPTKITEKTCPVIDLVGFDSKMWPVSMGMLADEIGIDIPLDANIYFSSDMKRRLTVGEIATRVMAFAPKGGSA